jgi:hypothetical protein
MNQYDHELETETVHLQKFIIISNLVLLLDTDVWHIQTCLLS